jgi:hypothetical protein
MLVNNESHDPAGCGSYMRGSGDVTSSLRLRRVEWQRQPEPGINQHPLNPAFLFLMMLTSVHFAPSRPSVAVPVQRHTQMSQSVELRMVYNNNKKLFIRNLR